MTAPSATVGAVPTQQTSISAGSGRWFLATVLAWLLMSAVLIFQNFDVIALREFHDPDDELRLVQVRDLLAGQGWFDLHQYRVAAADGGVLMHWSRLVDAPIAAAIAFLTPLIGSHAAELAALLLIPALTLLAIMTLVGWMASRTLRPGARLFAMLALAVASPVIIQVTPLRIDHHGWQIVTALAAVAAFLDRNERRGGLIAGVALATWMAISLEGLPFSALLIAITAAWALLDAAKAARLARIMQGLAGGSIALFLATRGVADLAVHCDAIAPVQIGIFAWGAVCIVTPIAARPGSRGALLAGLTAAGGGALVLLKLAAPQCATGTFDMLDPVVRTFWYDNVQEGKPLWHTELALFAQYTIPPLIGIWSAVSLARRETGTMREWWLFYALVLAAATAIALAVARSSSIAGALAVLPMGWRLASWLEGMRRPSNPLLRIGELVGVAALVFVAILPAVPVLAVKMMFADEAAAREAARPAKPACSVGKTDGAFDRLPAGGILAPLDFGPNVLLNSQRTVLATGHHRGAKTMRAVIDAFTGTPREALAVMNRHGLRYVLVCPNVQEMDLYRKKAPHGFAAQLLSGQAPSWLVPIALPAASGLRMWALSAESVSPAGTSAPRR